MFIAINRIQVKFGQESDIEDAFSRDSGLQSTPGFLGFELQKRTWNMHRKAENDEFLSVTRWASKDAFIAWTRSEAFRKAHARPKNEAIISAEPSGYEVVFERQPDAS